MMAASSHRCALMSRQAERAARRSGGVCTFQKITALPTPSGGRVVSFQFFSFQFLHQRFIHSMSSLQRLDSDFPNRSGSLLVEEPANV